MGAGQIPEEKLHLHGRVENTVNANYGSKPFSPHDMNLLRAFTATV